MPRIFLFGMMCKARPVYGDLAARQRVGQIVQDIIETAGWTGESAETIRHTREQMEATAGKSNLKRGAGGTVDIEFLVQMLQLRYASEHPEIMVSGTWAALEALREADLLSAEETDALSRSYSFLRNVEARIRLMDMAARHDLPSTETELATLAYLLEYDSTPALLEDVARYRRQNREHFESCVHRLTRELAS